MSRIRRENHELVVIRNKTYKNFLKKHSGKPLFIRSWRSIISARTEEHIHMLNNLDDNERI